jgi:hypothetical protein
MKRSVPNRARNSLLAVLVLAGFAAAACKEIRPEPNAKEGGVLESPTHEADALRRSEESRDQNRGGGGGGGGY